MSAATEGRLSESEPAMSALGQKRPSLPRL